MNGLDNWLQTPPGRYALAWEQAQFDAVVADIFGYHALQLGLSAAIDALAANRMPHRWRAALLAPVTARAGTAVADASTASSTLRTALVASPAALPFPEASLDLIALPHTLDCGSDPQAVLREVERVLVHEGRMVITGVNPASLWHLSKALPAAGQSVSPHGLRALLRNTELELQTVRHGGHGFAPRVQRDDPLPGRFDRWGAHLWPTLGALWCAVAVKRSRGAMLVGPAWKTPATAGAQAGVAQRTKPATNGLSAQSNGSD
ncbi:MAG: class I SAM-dependent methyltransferase [Burkholderiaceae bacterium]|nr:class I SAM-dependent methyltransferase [Burkholderiaceae bacterium]